MLEAGTDVNIRDGNVTALYCCAIYGNLEGAKMLLDFGANPNCNY